MADISVEQKKGGDLTWIWAAAAIIAIVALMAWLFSTREAAETAVVTDTGADTTAVAEAAGPPATDLAAVGGTPDQFVGQEIRVENVPIAAVLGDRGFWAEIPGQNPFLMVVGPEVTDAGWVAAGDTVSLSGTVQPVTEEVVNEWVTAGSIREGASAEASFATHYMQVTQAEP